MEEKTQTWHFVYSEDEESIYSKGVNIHGKSLEDCLSTFNNEYGFKIRVVYLNENFGK